MMPLVTRFADTVMSTGINVAQVHPGTFGMKDRLVTFFPPVDTKNFRPNPTRRSHARSELGVPENAILIGTVGNINPQKGHEYLIRAGSIIHSQVRDLFIRILGVYTPTQASYDAKLRKQTQDLGLANKEWLQFVDPGDRVADLLPAFDIFLMTSVPHSEGIPTVILEAMACGLPVVSTDIGGVCEVVEDGVTGLVVPPLNPIAIANATLHLLQNPELLQRMGKKARQRAVEYYDIEACANTHVRAFEAALAHHRSKRSRVSPDTL
jgi:glycosyltransferase involved in cell wall biosynthesis